MEGSREVGTLVFYQNLHSLQVLLGPGEVVSSVLKIEKRNKPGDPGLIFLSVCCWCWGEVEV